MSGFEGIKAAREYAATRVVVPTPPETMEERVARLTCENEQLRAAVSKTAEAIGAVVSPGCSADFMAILPDEARAKTARLTRERDEARAEVNRLLTALGKIASLTPHMHASPETVRDVERQIGKVISGACGVSDVAALAASLRRRVAEPDRA